MLFNDALIRRSQRALVPRVCMYTYVYVHTRVRIKKYMKKRSEVGGQSKVECFDVFPYSSVARCCSVSTYSCRESRPSRYVLWRKLPIRIYLPLRDRGKGNRSLTNTPRSINLDLLIFPGDIPSSRFSRHDLFECYSRNDISSFLRPSTGKASNSGSRTWTLKSWQTREERRRGTSVSTTCRIGRLPSDPYVQPVTCYQSRFRTICPLLPRFPHSSLSSRPSSSEFNSNLPRFAQSQPDRSSDCERLIARTKERWDEVFLQFSNAIQRKVLSRHLFILLYERQKDFHQMIIANHSNET